jgi:hypothetical protein
MPRHHDEWQRRASSNESDTLIDAHLWMRRAARVRGEWDGEPSRKTPAPGTDPSA